jgi:hypothetical protein
VAKRSQRFTTVDAYWTEDGDFLCTESGDLADTSSDPTRALQQEIRTVLLANEGDWLTLPGLGANLETFLGEKNDLNTARALGTSIIRALVEYQILNVEDFMVLPTPVRDFLLVRMVVTAPREDLVIQFGFDSKKKRFIGY